MGSIASFVLHESSHFVRLWELEAQLLRIERGAHRLWDGHDDGATSVDELVRNAP